MYNHICILYYSPYKQGCNCFIFGNDVKVSCMCMSVYVGLQILVRVYEIRDSDVLNNV